MGSVVAGLVEEALPGLLAELSTEEVDGNTLFLSSLTSHLDLETGQKPVVVAGHLEVKLKQSQVDVPAGPEDGRTRRVPDVDRLHVDVLLQVLVVVVHLLLRIHVLQHLGGLPPAIVGHDHHSLRLDLLDELLSALGQHGGRVGRAHQVDLFVVEALRQVNESRLEAVDSGGVKYLSLTCRPCDRCCCH